MLGVEVQTLMYAILPFLNFELRSVQIESAAFARQRGDRLGLRVAEAEEHIWREQQDRRDSPVLQSHLASGKPRSGDSWLRRVQTVPPETIPPGSFAVGVNVGTTVTG